MELDLTRQPWRSINGTFGVVRLVMQGDRPAPAPRGFVEALRDACDGTNIIKWRGECVPGQFVRVLSGPLAGLLGELDRMLDGDRVRVLLEIMGGRYPASLSRTDVAPADSML